VSSADLSRLTAVVRTCERPSSIERLVRSIGWLYPQMRILVADDSRKPRDLAGADLVKMPADVGVSACRNAVLARVRTPYFLLLEDDMELSRHSGVEKLLALVAGNVVDVAAGDCQQCVRRFGLFTSRRPLPRHATFEFGGDALRLAAGARAGADGCFGCDSAHNFFVARTDKVRTMGGWDPQLLVDERVEFFVRARRFGLRVGFAPEAVVRKWADRHSAAAARHGRDFMSLAVAKMGVQRLVDEEGRAFAAAAQAQAA
jgi:hypothetical protein